MLQDELSIECANLWKSWLAVEATVSLVATDLYNLWNGSVDSPWGAQQRLCCPVLVCASNTPKAQGLQNVDKRVHSPSVLNWHIQNWNRFQWHVVTPAYLSFPAPTSCSILKGDMTSSWAVISVDESVWPHVLPTNKMTSTVQTATRSSPSQLKRCICNRPRQ